MIGHFLLLNQNCLLHGENIVVQVATKSVCNVGLRCVYGIMVEITVCIAIFSDVLGDDTRYTSLKVTYARCNFGHESVWPKIAPNFVVTFTTKYFLRKIWKVLRWYNFMYEDFSAGQ